MSATTRETSDTTRLPRTGRRLSRGAIAVALTGVCVVAVGGGYAADALFGNKDPHGCGDTLDIRDGSAYEAIKYGNTEGQVMAGRLGNTVTIGLAIGKSINMFELHQFGDLVPDQGTTLTDGAVTVHFSADDVEGGVVQKVKISCSDAPVATATTS